MRPIYLVLSNSCLILHSDILASQFAVNTSVRLQLVLGRVAVLGVEVDLQDLGAVHSIADALADDLCWVHQVVQDGLVHLGQSTGPRPGGQTRGGLGQDAALGHDHHVLAGELLLQLADQTLLDLVEALKQTVWHLQWTGQGLVDWVQSRGLVSF